MKLINYSSIAAMLLFLTSCGKELSLEQGDPNLAKEKQLQNLMLTKKFQLRAFYSDVPIDYDDQDDTVKNETNLWPYVSNYLKDDYDSFQTNGTDMTVDQNLVKIPGNNAAVLYRKYSITSDDNGIHMMFLDYQYNALQYDVDKVGPDYFILSVKWKQKATLYSRFEIVP